MTFWDPIEQEWLRVLRAVPLPRNPHQPMVLNLPKNGAKEIPEDRSDFSRDDAATGV